MNQFRLCLTLYLILFSGDLARLNAQAIVSQYHICAGDLEKHELVVRADFIGTPRETSDLMMAIWSPGYYRVADYAKHVGRIKATDANQNELGIEKTSGNHWQVKGNETDGLSVEYVLVCDNNFVTTNWVSPEYGVLNGCAAFVIPKPLIGKPCSVAVQLPDSWKSWASGMESQCDEDQRMVTFQASNFDVLVDSPMIFGDIQKREFTVADSRHVWADLGADDSWNSNRAAEHASKIVAATHAFWGQLPFDHYEFLNVFRRGGGGLEHLNSTLLTANNARGGESWGWASFVAHEYFHAFNVKRLRPAALETLDYEQPPRTPSLWVSEGLTTYYGNLIVVRGGIGTQDDFISSLADLIDQLQDNPGRLKQSLEQASMQVWEIGQSGVGQDRESTVSYYVKGPVVGFLLDARIREITDGGYSLDDVMRIAYDRFSGESGFTEQQFRDIASEVAGQDLTGWFQQAIDTPGELDYQPALDWFGLEFRGGDSKGRMPGRLVLANRRSDNQKSHLDALTRPYPARPNQ